ncbi:MAG: glycosyltransferase family 4 protein [Chloroflexi bacterium]|nr:glycosyltransferase family 4 protein [Chloroflexota bacterium]
MRVLVGNKFYFELGGTERYVFQLEQMLRERGHEVIPFATRDPRNRDTAFERYFVEPVDYDALLGRARPVAAVLAAFRAIHSQEAKAKVQKLARETRPQIAHLHNVYHQISPSVLPALRELGVPIVLTLHDLKVLCPGYRMYSNGKICERCASGAFYHAARHRCLKNSLAASLVATIEAYVHAGRKTYEHNVTIFIAPSRFLMSKLARSRFGTARVEYLPHPIDLETFRPDHGSRGYFVYYGRLAREKGVLTLLAAAARLRASRFVIAGDGPYRGEIERCADRLGLRNVEFVGFRRGEELRAIVRGSAATVVPSEWYENAPFSLYESFALGKTVVASRIGGIPELVDHGEDGLLFTPGNDEALAEQLSFLWNHPSLAVEMGRRARSKAESNWGFEQHYGRLMQVYESAMNSSASG